MNISIGKEQRRVIAFLEKQTDWISPTKIGLSRGKEPHNASSLGSAKCLPLVEKGILERNQKGHYRIKK